MSATNWQIVKHQEKYLIVCNYQDTRYCVRYAYDTFEKAEYAMTNYSANFGQPNGEELDIAYNYWRYFPRFHYTFATKTRKDQFATYILNPNTKYN